MSETIHPNTQLIQDKSIAWDAAHAEKPYRELEIGARNAEFGEVAASLAIRACLESDAVVSAANSKSLQAQELLGAPEGPVGIRFHTFEQARSAKKEFSDDFIEGALTGTLAVGGNRVVLIKNYLDQVEQTDKDTEVISDPNRVAALYKSMTDMIARNLRVKVDQRLGSEINDAVSSQGNEFLKNIWEARNTVPQAMIRWMKGVDRGLSDKTIGGLEYRGFTLNDKDVLDIDSNIEGVRSNIRVQRGKSGPPFVMAYTDARIQQKMGNNDNVLSKRICLNPDFEATPQIFEQIYQIANKAGVPMQIKTFLRAPEAASANKAQTKNGNQVGLRGDGILVYVDDEHADAVLETVLSVAEQNSDAFKNRRTSRIYQNVANGIGVGDEPIGQEGSSLTKHRSELLERAKATTLASGQTGHNAHKVFRDTLANEARMSGVDPDNVAFNMAA